MGWLANSDWTKSSLIKHLNEMSQDDKLLKSCVRGDTLWQVLETPRGRFIGCIVLQKCDGDWGYKAMGEGSHPYRYHCPLGYLDLVPEVTSEEWRAEVRKYHETQKTKSKTFLLKVHGGITQNLRYAKGYTLETVRQHFEQIYKPEYFTVEVVR